MTVRATLQQQRQEPDLRPGVSDQTANVGARLGNASLNANCQTCTRPGGDPVSSLTGRTDLDRRTKVTEIAGVETATPPSAMLEGAFTKTFEA